MFLNSLFHLPVHVFHKNLLLLNQGCALRKIEGSPVLWVNLCNPGRPVYDLYEELIFSSWPGAKVRHHMPLTGHCQSTTLLIRCTEKTRKPSAPPYALVSSRLFSILNPSNIVTRQFRAWKTRLTRTCSTTRPRRVSLHHNFQGVKYEAEKCKMQRVKWQNYACVKGLGWNKHKFVHVVKNGSLHSQGVVITSRCSWHEGFDRYASDFYRIQMDKWCVLWIKIRSARQLYHAGIL